MASVVRTYDTGETLYLILRDDSHQVWNTDTEAFEAFDSENYADYAIEASEQGDCGYYYATTPDVDDGWYRLDWRVQVGGSPAQSDPCITLESAYWDGTRWPGVDISAVNNSRLAAKVLSAHHCAHVDDCVLLVDLTGCDTDAERGVAFDAAITAVQALEPGGNAISSTNRATLLIPEAHYDVAGLEPTISVDGINLFAINPQMGGHRQVGDLNTIDYYRPSPTQIYTTTAGKHTLIQDCDDVQMRGFTIAQLSGDTENNYSALYVASETNVKSVYDMMYFWNTASVQDAAGGNYRYPVGFAKHVNGSWSRGIANNCAWRFNNLVESAQFSATMTDMEAGYQSYIGDYSATGGGTQKATKSRLIRCHAIGGDATHPGGKSFGGCDYYGCDIDATCYLEDCSAGDLSYALDKEFAATAIRVRGADACFGGYGESGGTFTGYGEDLYATGRSFGAVGGMTGILNRVIALMSATPLKVGSTGRIKDSLIVQGSNNTDAITLSGPAVGRAIEGSLIAGLGTGKAINAATALTFAGGGNTYVGGLGTNVTNAGSSDDVALTPAAVEAISTQVKTDLDAAHGEDSWETGEGGDADAIADAVLQRDVAEVEAAIIASGNKDCIGALVLQLRHANTTDNPGYLTVYTTTGEEFEQISLSSQSTTDTIVGIGNT